MSRLLLNKIDSVRRKQVALNSACAIAGAITALVVLFAAGMFFDWIFDFPRVIRALLLTGYVCAAGYIIGRYMVMPIVQGPDDDELALLVEEAEPQFGHRLIGAIQLSRPNAIPDGASLSLVKAMIAQAESLAGAFDFGRVIKADRFMRLGLGAVAAVLLGGAAFVYGNTDHVTGDLLKRAFLSDIPVPRKTHVEVLSGNMKIASGEAVEISARARGVVPSSGRVMVTTASGRKQEFILEPTPGDKAVFTRKISDNVEGFTYSVKLNDGVSEAFQVKTLVRPAVTDLQITQAFPGYTHRATTRLEPGNLSVLSGSHLLLKVTANHAVAAMTASGTPGNYVHLVGVSTIASTQPGQDATVKQTMLSDVRLNIDPSNSKLLTADVALPPKISGFSLHLVDDEGLESKDPVVYRVDLEPDKDPSVHITSPIHKEELETIVASLPISFIAGDDFGLSKVTIKYKVDEGDVQSIPVTVPANANPFKYTYELRIGSITLPPTTTRPSLEGSTIEYWIECEDNNNVTGPGKGASEHYSIKVVTEEEKHQQLLQMMSDQVEIIKNGASEQENAVKEAHKIIGQ